MSYVPIVVTTPTQEPPSRQTLELANLLGRVVEEYEKAHPTVSGAEVRRALQMAQSASSKVGSNRAPLVAALATGLMVMMGVLAFFFVQGGGDSLRGGINMIFIVVGLLAVGAVVWAARRSP